MAKLGDVLLQPETGWSRFDDTNSLIAYETPDGGEWVKGQLAGPSYYNETVTYKGSGSIPRLKVKFKFKGTQVRLIGTRFNLVVFEQSTVLIDGVATTSNYNQSGTSNQFMTLLFESSLLTDGEHLVEIITSKDAFDIDAIDVRGGQLVSLTSKVGDVLQQPESGWSRFDDDNSLIKYGEGKWNRFTDGRYYNSTAVFSNIKSVVEFSFKGTGIRLVSKSIDKGYGPIDITIDGVKESFNPVFGTNNWQVLVYDKKRSTSRSSFS